MTTSVRLMHNNRLKHHNKPEQRRSHVHQQEERLQNTSPWVPRLTTHVADPFTFHHLLSSAGETIRIQALHTMQKQNGNRYIQRDGIYPAHQDYEDIMLPNASKTVAPAPAAPAPVPIPYPNAGQTTQNSTPSQKVNFTDKSVLNSSSKIGQSKGDETGTIKGMVGNAIKDAMQNKKYSPKVIQQGAGVTLLPSDITLASRTMDENTAPVGKQGGLISEQLSNRISRNLGSGSALSGSQQTHMEHKFGTSFPNVRLHTDTEADAISQQLNARAFTLGSDIFFSRRTSPQDEHLLSHELTHVVQQQQMPTSGPMTVGPADDFLERQADENASGTSSNAYALPFEQQRDLAIQRDLMDEFTLGNISGIIGTGSDVATGLNQLKNLSLAQQLGMTAPQLSNITQAPIIGTLGKIAAPIGLLTGSMDLMNSDKPLHERILGGMSALGGATGTASTIAGWLGSGLFSAGGAAGLSAGAGSALTGGGASLLSGAGAATALGSLGAVAGAGAGGYALGRLLDEGFGGLANLIAGDKKEDRTLSGYASRGMTWLDKKISGLWRDPSKPAYTQTIGWKLANWLGI